MASPVRVLVGSVVLAGLAIVLIPVPAPSPDLNRTQGQGRALSAPAAEGAGVTMRHTRWPELMLPNWDPYRLLREFRKDTRITWDGDPRAAEMHPKRCATCGMTRRSTRRWTALRCASQATSSRSAKASGGSTSSCWCRTSAPASIRPRPPSNQIIHVVLRAPLAGVRSMNSVWVGGILKVARSDSLMGTSSDRLAGIKVEPYLPPRRD